MSKAAEQVKAAMDDALERIAAKIRSCVTDEAFLDAGERLASTGRGNGESAARIALRIAFTQAALFVDEFREGYAVQVVERDKEPTR